MNCKCLPSLFFSSTFLLARLPQSMGPIEIKNMPKQIGHFLDFLNISGSISNEFANCGVLGDEILKLDNISCIFLVPKWLTVLVFGVSFECSCLIKDGWIILKTQRKDYNKLSLSCYRQQSRRPSAFSKLGGPLISKIYLITI